MGVGWEELRRPTGPEWALRPQTLGELAGTAVSRLSRVSFVSEKWIAFLFHMWLACVPFHSPGPLASVS